MTRVGVRKYYKGSECLEHPPRHSLIPLRMSSHSPVYRRGPKCSCVFVLYFPDTGSQGPHLFFGIHHPFVRDTSHRPTLWHSSYLHRTRFFVHQFPRTRVCVCMYMCARVCCLCYVCVCCVCSCVCVTLLPLSYLPIWWSDNGPLSSTFLLLCWHEKFSDTLWPVFVTEHGIVCLRTEFHVLTPTDTIKIYHRLIKILIVGEHIILFYH